jgi:hypothetical protein
MNSEASSLSLIALPGASNQIKILGSETDDGLLSFQVDQHIHELGAGLEHFGICGIAALSFNHIGQFLCDIDVRTFERAGLDPAKPSSAR